MRTSRSAQMLGLGIAFGLLPACGNPTIEDKIPEGIVTSRAYTSESQYTTIVSCDTGIDAKGNPTISCSSKLVYVGEEDTVTVTVEGCRRIDDKKVVADTDYLKSHQKYPSDYPIVGGHFVEEGPKVNHVTTCTYDVELEFEYGKRLTVGDLVVMSELYGHDDI